jgi:hypothetical protein
MALAGDCWLGGLLLICPLPCNQQFHLVLMLQGTTAHDCRMHAAAGLRLLCLPLHHSTRGIRSLSWCVAELLYDTCFSGPFLT